MTDLISRVDMIVARWLNPAVEHGEERGGQIAVFRLLMGAVAALLILLPPLLLMGFALPLAVAATAGAAAGPLIVAAVLSATGSLRWTGITGLGFAAAAIATLSATSGGAASPFIGWLAFLPLAAALAGRSWGWFATGMAAACAACAAAVLTGSDIPASAGLVLSALLPVAGLAAYGLARLSIMLEGDPSSGPETREGPVQGGNPALDCLQGLITIHDLRGDVVAVHGVDAERFAEWLDPMARGFFNQVHVGDRLAFMQAIDAVRHGAARAAVTLRMHAPFKGRPGDRLLHVESHLSPMRDSDGTIDRIVMQSLDVTARLTSEAEMESRIEAAESANGAKTRYLAAMSHELRTPLNAIIGFSQTLSGEYFGGFESEKQRDYVKLIRQSGDHMLSVVNSLLDMSRIEAGRYDLRYETFRVRDAVGRCEAMLAGQAETKGVLLTSRLARNCDTVTADVRAFEQILINLVANAVKFTEKGGVVTIDAERRGNILRVGVSDTGIGISAEHLDVIGEPFTQLSGVHGRRGEGSGLGLSLVKGLVSLHEGGFSISSTIGEGTVVTIELPRDGMPSKTGEAGPAVVFPPPLPTPPLPTDTGHSKREETDGYDDAKAQTA